MAESGTINASVTDEGHNLQVQFNTDEGTIYCAYNKLLVWFALLQVSRVSRVAVG